MRLRTAFPFAHPRRRPQPQAQWANLLYEVQCDRRSFGEDVTQCPRCGDRLGVLAFLTHPVLTAAILDHLGLAFAVPPIAPARAPPDDDVRELDLGTASTVIASMADIGRRRSRVDES